MASLALQQLAASAVLLLQGPMAPRQTALRVTLSSEQTQLHQPILESQRTIWWRQDQSPVHVRLQISSVKSASTTTSLALPSPRSEAMGARCYLAHTMLVGVRAFLQMTKACYKCYSDISRPYCISCLLLKQCAKMDMACQTQKVSCMQLAKAGVLEQCDHSLARLLVACSLSF